MSTDFWRSLVAICLWLVLAAGVSFVVAVSGFGLGAMTIILGLFLGFCGMTVHLLTWALGWRMHWSWAGILIAAVTQIAGVLLFMPAAADPDPWVLFYLFLYFALVASIVFPIVDRILRN